MRDCGRRCRPDQDVAGDAAAEAGRDREHDHPEDIHSLAGGEQRPGQGEGERADQIQRVEHLV